MLEQEKEKEDQYILQAIIYLGQRGVLSESAANETTASGLAPE